VLLHWQFPVGVEANYGTFSGKLEIPRGDAAGHLTIVGIQSPIVEMGEQP
jgi:hypothetical protein